MPASAAAPPANDDFAAATPLSGLPVDLTATNVEATKEEGEPLHGGIGSKGHSVWFEWEATSTEFVTVGTCGSDFVTVLAVYTGTAVGELTKVAGDYPSSGGPGCAEFNGRQVTFEAIAGTVYEIVVDGDPFYLPPQEPPAGEGTFGLQIDSTPVPPNDDFAEATPIVGSIAEEPEAKTAIYSASVMGYNWNAGKESGEPEHAGDPGGASVWYSWTAPGTGTVSAGACGGNPLLVGVYTGNSVDALTPVGTHDFGSCAVTFPAGEGTTYRIAVDGKFDAEEGGPALRNFSVNVFMELPLRPKSDPPPSQQALPTDAVPPDTKIAKRLLDASKRRVTFRFESSEPGFTFLCRLDAGALAPCRSPKSYRNLKPGRHVFRVFAVDSAGNVDPWAAISRFRMPKPRHDAKGQGRKANRAA